MVLTTSSHDKKEEKSKTEDDKTKMFENKISLNGYRTSIYIIHAGEDNVEAVSAIKEVTSTLSVYSQFGQNTFTLA